MRGESTHREVLQGVCGGGRLGWMGEQVPAQTIPVKGLEDSARHLQEFYLCNHLAAQ